MSDLKARLASQLNIETSGTAQDYSDLIPAETETSLLPLDAPCVQVVPEFAITFNEAKNRLVMLQTFVKELMIPGLDYGLIPGCQKPSLFKSGAEKLCDIYGFSKLVAVINRFEDWQEGFFSYEVKATLMNKRTGLVEAEGVGCCNSRERKYKNQDAFNIGNTILKMAKKRALVDAVLSATRSSGIFSQDIEDFKVDKAPTLLRVLPVQPDKPVTQKQLSDIFSLIKSQQIPIDRAKSIMIERYKFDESRQLTSSMAHDFLDFLRNLGQVATINA